MGLGAREGERGLDGVGVGAVDATACARTAPAADGALAGAPSAARQAGARLALRAARAAAAHAAPAAALRPRAPPGLYRTLSAFPDCSTFTPEKSDSAFRNVLSSRFLTPFVASYLPIYVVTTNHSFSYFWEHCPTFPESGIHFAAK